MFATQVRGKSRTRLLSLALAGGMAFAATAGSTEALAAVNPGSSSSSMVRPSVAATASATITASSTPLVAVGQTRLAALSMRVARVIRARRGTRVVRGYVSNWSAVPGHPSYWMSDFQGDPYRGYFGVCTWYAWYRNQNLPLMQLGNAAAWPAHASRFGLRVSSQPVVGAAVVFAPGVQGASSRGHAGVVEQVLGGGWLMISEMNFYWNGGGWGRVDYRYIHVGRGVWFIF